MEFSDRAALRAEQVRAQVLRAKRIASRATAADLDNFKFGRWSTADGLVQRLTITLSMREAISLVRVVGPMNDRRDLSLIASGGPVARLLAAIHVIRQAVMRQPGGGLAVLSAIVVLRVALDELERSYSPPVSKKPLRRR